LKLPEKHRYSEGAPSRWQVLDEPDAPLRVEEAKASGALGLAEEAAVPFTAVKEKGKGVVRVEALAYFCREEAACRIASVLFEVPVEVGDGGRETARLEHTFDPQADPFAGALGPASRPPR
jgi:hypothetical protein